VNSCIPDICIPQIFTCSYISEIDVTDIPTFLSIKTGKKAKPGLSTFISHPQDIFSYLLPILREAADIIPAEHHRNASLYIKGTGGMRSLSEQEQDLIWNHVFTELKNSNVVPFMIKRENLGTISGMILSRFLPLCFCNKFLFYSIGKMEAYAAVITSNFLAGRIDSFMR
jgi:hypothetical protein